LLVLLELVLPALLLACASLGSPVQTSTSERIAAYFRGWFAHIPGSEVSIQPAKEISLSGFEGYRVDRRSSSKAYQESTIALYEPASGEVFVGEVLQDLGRAASGPPFNAARDLPNIEASLREAFGLPVKIEIGARARGLLIPMTVSIQLDKSSEATSTRTGFVSRDGSTLMLGEFQPLADSPAAFREKLLAQSEGIRTKPGRFTVTEFLDFQCERCRFRTPEVRRAVEEKGGAVEIRFLPLAKIHPWAFAAAESGAALAAIRPELYLRYEEAVFARAEGMSVAAARDLAGDIAEAAGTRDAFAGEISSGRARARVARDASLALRLGVLSTPSFLFRGTVLPGEKGALETFLWESIAAQPRRTAAPAR
jgi:thioredoxin family protein